MRITWLGHASFLLESGSSKLVTDPFDNIGLEFPAVEADAVTTSHAHFDHNAAGKVDGNPEVISGVGDFSHEPFAIRGVATYHDESQGAQRGENTVYMIECEGLRVCHLGDLGHELSASQAESLGHVDVLMIPVGGTYTIDAGQAVKVVEALGPAVVLPMHYKVEGLSLPIAPVGDFAGRFSNVRESEYLDITSDLLPAETEVVILKRKS